MTELQLVTTDDRAAVLGTISLDTEGVAHFSGGAGPVFQQMRRRLGRDASDLKVFNVLKSGWSNGPAKIVAVE